MVDSMDGQADKLFRAELSIGKDCKLVLAGSQLDHWVMTWNIVTMRGNTRTTRVT